MTTTQTSWKSRPLSEKQSSYIKALVAKKNAMRDEAKAVTTQGEASDLIDQLLKLVDAPKPVHKSVPPKAEPELPAGQYALYDEHDSERVWFYNYNKGTGTWDGYTFLFRYRSDDEVKIMGKEKIKILTKIKDNFAAAVKLFGDKTGRCGFCGKRLTDPESLARGCGNTCAEKHGIA